MIRPYDELPPLGRWLVRHHMGWLVLMYERARTGI